MQHCFDRMEVDPLGEEEDDVMDDPLQEPWPEDTEQRRLDMLGLWASKYPQDSLVSVVMAQVTRLGWTWQCDDEIDSENQKAPELPTKPRKTFERGYLCKWDVQTTTELLDAMNKFQECLNEMDRKGVRATTHSRWAVISQYLPNRIAMEQDKFAMSCRTHFANLCRVYKGQRRTAKDADLPDDIKQGIADYLRRCQHVRSSRKKQGMKLDTILKMMNTVSVTSSVSKQGHEEALKRRKTNLSFPVDVENGDGNGNGDISGPEGGNGDMNGIEDGNGNGNGIGNVNENGDMNGNEDWNGDEDGYRDGNGNWNVDGDGDEDGNRDGSGDEDVHEQVRQRPCNDQMDQDTDSLGATQVSGQRDHRVLRRPDGRHQIGVSAAAGESRPDTSEPISMRQEHKRRRLDSRVLSKWKMSSGEFSNHCRIQDDGDRDSPERYKCLVRRYKSELKEKPLVSGDASMAETASSQLAEWFRYLETAPADNLEATQVPSTDKSAPHSKRSPLRKRLTKLSRKRPENIKHSTTFTVMEHGAAVGIERKSGSGNSSVSGAPNRGLGEKSRRRKIHARRDITEKTVRLNIPVDVVNSMDMSFKAETDPEVEPK